MALSSGARIGPYEIVAPIGAGGMGEVYRARDTKLGRDVAIKMLPDAFASDADRMARFEREARVLASLNHPNIAAIYGIEGRALVMELVEGATIADRIAQGPVPLDEALGIAWQMVDALTAAHEKGIIHRDLKPANVKITPEGAVKVLDFGLAKAADEAQSSSSEISPTLTLRETQAGMILGTAAYMSPEQARGKPADRRADIWSFGVVLYEMLTGRRLFEGETISDTLAAVLKAEPDWNRVPAKARRLLQSCLQKNPKQRLQAIGDAPLLLEDTPIEPTRARPLPWLLAGALALALVAASWMAWRAMRRVEHPLARLNVDLGADAVAGASTTAVISPDGTRLVYSARGQDGKQRLATRLLEQAQSTPLTGTEYASDPFFSPDGQWIGFFANGKLKKISVQGGAPVILCDSPSGRGASWGENGEIIAALNRAGQLSRVPASGGPPQRLTKPTDTLVHRWPQVLRDGLAVLFTTSSSPVAFDNADIEAISIKNGAKKTLLRGGYFGQYLPTNGSTGHLVYVSQRVLFAVPFDPARLELQGTPAPVLDDLAGNTVDAGGQFDFSKTGTFVYLSAKSSIEAWPVVWLDSTGRTQPLVTKPGAYFTPRVSPDGQRLALSVQIGKDTDIYIFDRRHDTMSRLTFTEKRNVQPIWTPDGGHIAFGAADGIGWVRADGAREFQLLFGSQTNPVPSSFTPDGHRLAYFEANPETGFDIWTLNLDTTDPDHPKPGKPEPFLRGPYNELLPEFSPDGRWISYTSEESGSREVYVRPFPGPGGKWQISTDGGHMSSWSRNGRELFFKTLDDHIMVADYTAEGDSFLAGKPRLWSPTQVRATGTVNLAIAPDGKHFAVFPVADTIKQEQGSLHVTFLLNFFDELRRRVPARK